MTIARRRALAPGVASTIGAAFRDARRAWNARAWASVAAFAVLAAVPAIVNDPGSLSRLASGLYIALAAVGLNFTIGLAGLPSLGQGAFVGAGAFTTAWLRVHGGWEPIPATLVGVALAFAAGAVVGYGAVRLRGVFVAVSTWILAWMLSFILTAFPGLSGGSQGLVMPTARMGIPGTGVVVQMTEGVHFELALVLLALALLVFASVSRGPAGLAFAAAREGPAQATALGIDRPRLHLGAFVTSAAIGGLAGALSVQLAGVADPSAYGPLLSIELFVAVLLGGEGRVLGPAVGAGLLVLIPGAARGLGSFAGVGLARYEPVLAAALLVVGLLLGRGGVVRILERALHLIGLRADRSDASADPDARHAAPPPRRGAMGLRARGVSRRFGGVTALDRVDLDVRSGEVHAIVGPNGSGKTTLLRVLAGTVGPEEGHVELGVEDVTRLSPELRARAGVVRTLQRTAVFEDLSVLEHVAAGATAGREAGGVFRALLATPRSRAETAEVRGRAMHLLGLARLAERAGDRAGSLEAGDRRLLVVATAAASFPSVLLLDEPSAGMTPLEEDRLERLVRSLSSAGVAVVMVEHDFPLVARIADRATVLDAGRVLASGSPAEVRALDDVRAAYLG